MVALLNWYPDAVSQEIGLRERKKLQTRQQIFDAASRLFGERGFDSVTVAEVARAADVSEVTVFNYFPTKEDLFYFGMESFESRLVDAVRRRPEGESVLDAFAGFVDAGFDNLRDPQRASLITKAETLVRGSPALQARDREIVARYTRELALLLADEHGVDEHDVAVWTVAGSLMSAHRAVVAYVRSRVLAGRSGPRLVADGRAEARRAFGLIRAGFEGYAVKKPG